MGGHNTLFVVYTLNEYLDLICPGRDSSACGWINWYNSSKKYKAQKAKVSIFKLYKTNFSKNPTQWAVEPDPRVDLELFLFSDICI